MSFPPSIFGLEEWEWRKTKLNFWILSKCIRCFNVLEKLGSPKILKIYCKASMVCVNLLKIFLNFGCVFMRYEFSIETVPF